MPPNDRKGYVYLIVNDQIRGRVKIGYTMKEPIDRAIDLRSTGTTGTFVVVYQALVVSPKSVETEVHRRLAGNNVGLEWFAVCPNLAKETIVACAGTVLFEDTSPRWHSSQPEPEAWTKTLLREAKIAADKENFRRQEAERAASLEAERRRLDEARRAEAARRAAEIAESHRLAAEQAEADRRKREQEIEAAKRRSEADAFFGLLAVAGLLAGLALAGVAVIKAVSDRRATSASAMATSRGPAARPAAKKAATITAPQRVTDPKVAKHQRLVEQAESRAASLRAGVSEKHQAVASLEAEAEGFLGMRQQRQSDLASAQAALDGARKRLVDKQQRLKRLAIEEPRDLQRSGELFRGEGDVRKLEEDVAEAQLMVSASKRACDVLPQHEQYVRDRLLQARAAVKEAEQRLAEEVEALEAAKRELAEVVRRSQVTRARD
jgi:hypothetical protein